MLNEKVQNVADISIEEKLRALYELQQVYSKVDEIRRLRGDMPLEVQDLEDEITGLETRIKKYEEEVAVYEKSIVDYKNKIKDFEGQIKKYTAQQQKVRNNREFDSLSKEVEYQNLEIELANKRISEATDRITEKSIQIHDAKRHFSEKNDLLNHNKAELNLIINETQKEEEELNNRAGELERKIEARLVTAFKRIRGNAKNGLAVVTIQRDACGGCYNQIPPQRQLDIRTRKKIIVCEHCGRILVGEDLNLEQFV